MAKKGEAEEVDASVKDTFASAMIVAYCGTRGSLYAAQERSQDTLTRAQ